MPASISLRNASASAARANSKMVEPGGTRSRRRAAFAFPGVQSDVVVITACREERCVMPVALHQIKAEHATIEGDGAI